MLVYVKKVTYAAISEGSEDYGFCDRQGRKVGYHWNIALETFVILPEAQAVEEGGCSRYGLERIERPYRVGGSPTRDGRHYGPTNSTHCASLNEAQKNVANRIKQARKRDEKKFVKPATENR